MRTISGRAVAIPPRAIGPLIGPAIGRDIGTETRIPPPAILCASATEGAVSAIRSAAVSPKLVPFIMAAPPHSQQLSLTKMSARRPRLQSLYIFSVVTNFASGTFYLKVDIPSDTFRPVPQSPQLPKGELECGFSQLSS
jgi:hypothetical protein